MSNMLPGTGTGGGDGCDSPRLKKRRWNDDDDRSLDDEIILDNDDISLKNFRNDKYTYLKAVESAMYNAYKLIENLRIPRLQSNPALHVLRDRIEKGLQLYSAVPTEPCLSYEDYGEIFSNQRIWFVDDSFVHRCREREEALEGGIAYMHVNGAIFIFDPLTGRLYLKVVHASLWDGQTHQCPELAKWKTAEAVAALLQSLPVEEQPKQIISSEEMFDYLEVHLLGFPNIVIKVSEPRLPFEALLNIEKYDDLVLKAKEPQMLTFNMYDDWLKSIPSCKAFSRLIHILGAVNLKYEEALNLGETTTTGPEHNWPSLTDDQWAKVEVSMRDLILSDYAEKKNIDRSCLTQSDIHDVILGVTVTPSQQQHQNAEIEKEADWRERFVPFGELYIRSNHIYVHAMDSKEIGATYIISKELLRKFICISDSQTQIAGYLYGSKLSDNPQKEEIRCIVMPPQLGTPQHVNLPSGLPEHEFLNDFEPLGWIHTQPKGSCHLTPQDLVAHARILANNPQWDVNRCIILTCCYTSEYFSLTAYRPTPLGYEWGLKNKDSTISPYDYRPYFYEEVQMVLSDSIHGCFMVPNEGSWNYNFRKEQHKADMKFSLKQDVPLEFYHEEHKPTYCPE